jgi:glycosyltransferase involved in cell wall biosynthesis
MISVIVCTYNRAASLRKTLESLGQMFVPPDLTWELIVVDNNSADRTREVVGEFARTSEFRVRYVFEPKQGLCHARNTGVANATGEIIAFTDDDVQVAPEWLGELAHMFKECDCMGVGGRSIPAWNGLSKPDWLISAGPYSLASGPILDFDLGEEAKELSVSVPPWGLNMAFRKSAFEKYGMFRTDLDVSGSGGLLGGDTEFGQRLLARGDKIMYSPKAVVFHPVEQRRITKGYFLRYYFRLGRTDIRQGGLESHAVLYFGVPRYMFRMLAQKSRTWLFAFGGRRRFYFKAQAFRLIGQMIEAYKLSSLNSRDA